MAVPPDNQIQQRQPARDVTVAVPTLNRGAAILPTLCDLLAQTHRPLEVLIVDQSPEVHPEVLAFARAHQDVVSLHHVTFRGLPQARNYAWQHARHDAIVYVDDDTRIPENLAAEHLRALLMPGIGVVAGSFDEPNRPDPGPPTGVFNRWTAEPTRGWDASHEGEADHAPGGNFAIWRSVAREAGGFDESLGAAAALFEELEFCLRARNRGHRVYFNGKAHLTHLPAPSGGCRVDQAARQVWGLARNRMILVRRHLRWHEKPVAILRQVRQCAGFAKGERSLRVFLAGLSGMREGWMQGGKAPVCTVREAAPVDLVVPGTAPVVS